MITESSMMS
jgi:mitogen-activated protein kinase 1/3